MCWFFHQIAPPGPIRGTLGRFWFFPKIRGDIRIWNRFRGVSCTTESTKRRPFQKILSSNLSCYMMKKCISGLFFGEFFLQELWLAFHLFSNGLPCILHCGICIWRCKIHYQVAIPRCILHPRVATRRCKIHCRVALINYFFEFPIVLKSEKKNWI